MNAPLAPLSKPDLTPEPGTTPVMAQFLAAKAGQPDAILFFRMGDFYELFFEDAETAAGALGIALTKRGKHQGRDIPMAGVPVHAMEGYLARLIRMGTRWPFASSWKTRQRPRSAAPRPWSTATSCGSSRPAP